ncbi:MAG: hypothetical protein NTX15_06475, partial [Candidatus Kapabacteria bacterium]|nr:hypothetical protein [Candidatus Kapabacteria bacterium]
MKNVLLLAMFVASAALGIAQQPVATRGHDMPTSINPADLVRQPIGKEEEATQGVIFKRVTALEVSSQFHYWPYGPVSNDMFKYDAKSNTLNIARNKALFNASNQISGVEVGVLRSTNNGVAWTMDVIQSTTSMFFGMPILGYVNPDEGTDASKFPVMVFGIRYPMPSLNYGGLSMWNRTSAGPYELTLNDQPAPANGYAITMGDLYSDNNSGAVHYSGTLNPDAGVQYGAYGYFNMNLVVDD